MTRIQEFSRSSAATALRAVAGRMARATEGVAAVEFALFAPLLIAMCLAITEFGSYIGTRIELEQALRAGGQFALKDHTDNARITSAVLNSTSLSGITVSVSPLACECPDGTPAQCRGESNYAECTGGIPPAGYVTINGTTTYVPFFIDLDWFSLEPDIAQSLTMRVL